MKKNPEIVTESILDAEGTTIDKTIKVHPISIYRYAWLERLNSPFINTDIPFGVDTIIPTAFIFCQPPEVLSKYNSTDAEQLKKDAYIWADENLELSDVPELIKNVTKQMNQLNKAAPSGGEDGTSESKSGSKKK